MALANSAAYSTANSAAANLNPARTGYIPPFRSPFPGLGEGPVQELEASGGTLIEHAASRFPGQDANEAEDLGGEEQDPRREHKGRLSGPPDPRFRASSEAFAALIEFVDMLGNDFSGDAQLNEPARIKKAVILYELIEQIIRGTLYKPGGKLSISL